MSPEILLRFVEHFDASGKAMLKALGIENAFSRLDDDDDLPVPRVVIQSSGFARASNHMAFAKNRQPFHDHRTGQLNFTITTKRNAPGIADHNKYLGIIAAAHERPRGAYKDLPYKIIKIEDGPGSVTFIRDGDRDRSELFFTVEFGIPGALMDFADASL